MKEYLAPLARGVFCFVGTDFFLLSWVSCRATVVESVPAVFEVISWVVADRFGCLSCSLWQHNIVTVFWRVHHANSGSESVFFCWYYITPTVLRRLAVERDEGAVDSSEAGNMCAVLCREWDGGNGWRSHFLSLHTSHA